MRRFSVRSWLFAAILLPMNVALGDERAGPQWPLIDCELPEFARRVFKITDLVLDQHIEPPTRQEMLLCGLTALYPDGVPDGLSRGVSSVASEDDFVQCLLRYWPQADKAASGQELRTRFLYGLSGAVPGGLDFQSAKEAAVARQLAANQYVGIGISLTRAGKTNACQIGGTFPRGPAAKAGIAAGDFIVEIDGSSAKDLSLEQVVDRLRGPEGTTVAVGLTRPGESESRTVKLTRSVVPRQTVVGIRELEPEKWECVVDGRVPVAYLNVREINGGTVAELREYEAELAAKNVGFLVLDLRATDCSELRHALHFADALLDRGRAATIRSRGRRVSLPLDRDSLFSEWPMAVLVSEYTTDFAEWLAGLLQQYRGAVLVGRPTTGEARFILTPVDLPNDWGVVRLATAVLEREPMRREFADRAPSAAGIADESVARSSANTVTTFLFRNDFRLRHSLKRPHAVMPDVLVALESGEAAYKPTEYWLSQAIEALTARTSKGSLDQEKR